MLCVYIIRCCISVYAKLVLLCSDSIKTVPVVLTVAAIPAELARCSLLHM